MDSEIGHRSTQIDPEDDPPVRSGRFASLSSDNPNAHVCRAPTNAIVSPREGLTGTRKRRRRLRPLPWSWDDTDSDEEQTHPTQADFVRSHRGRHVVPRRDGELPATIPRILTPEKFPLDIVDALQEDLDPRHAPRFPVSVQNRFDALDSTARDSSGLKPLSVDGSGVDIFPMTDDAALQVLVEPVRHRPCWRLVLILQSQGTPHFIQDRHDVSEGEARHVVPQDPISSDAEFVNESVDQVPVGEDDREGLSEVEGEEEEFVPERAPVDIDVRARTIAVGWRAWTWWTCARCSSGVQW